jgi:hypothetical protein
VESICKNSEGIAIESSYEHLINSLSSYEEFDVFIGMVRYLDYKCEALPIGNMLLPYLCKRKSFEHEKELRALIWTPQHEKNWVGIPRVNKFHDKNGLYVPVNLNELISRIFVAPTAPLWILELLESIVGKYGLKKDVIQSDLASFPIY